MFLPDKDTVDREISALDRYELIDRELVIYP